MIQENIVKEAKLSVVSLIFKLLIDIVAMCILVGFIWFLRDLIAFFTTKLKITNKRVTGKTGLINTNELDSPLNKINSTQVKQGLMGKICNYGTVIITTASSSFIFNYISAPNEFKTILNNQIEQYDEDRIKAQAEKIANTIK